MDGYQYLATPYSLYPHGRDAAYRVACRCSAAFLRAGIFVFSPIAHSHGIAEQSSIGTDHLAWRAFNETMLGHSDGLVVACLQGWQDSAGIRDEIAFARGANLPVLWWQLGLTPPGRATPPLDFPRNHYLTEA